MIKSSYPDPPLPESPDYPYVLIRFDAYHPEGVIEKCCVDRILAEKLCDAFIRKSLQDPTSFFYAARARFVVYKRYYPDSQTAPEEISVRG